VPRRPAELGDVRRHVPSGAGNPERIFLPPRDRGGTALMLLARSSAASRAAFPLLFFLSMAIALDYAHGGIFLVFMPGAGRPAWGEAWGT
jgi:hypothetical protein